jgi:hypothetical protein
MASKKGILKAIGLILAGFLVGAILVGGLITWQWSVFFKNWDYMQILEETHIISMIRGGREKELIKTIELNLPQWVADANSMRGNSKMRLESLWSVQRYYETFDINVPAEIQPILKNLPPRPLTSCEKKKIQDANTEPNKAEITK